MPEIVADTKHKIISEQSRVCSICCWGRGLSREALTTRRHEGGAGCGSLTGMSLWSSLWRHMSEEAIVRKSNRSDEHVRTVEKMTGNCSHTVGSKSAALWCCCYGQCHNCSTALRACTRCVAETAIQLNQT